MGIRLRKWRALPGALFLLLGTTPLLAQGPTLTLGSAAGAPGATVMVPISIDNVDGIVGIDLTLDATSSTPIRQTPPTLGEAVVGRGAMGSVVLTDVTAPGRARIILSDDSGFIGPGELLRLPFTLPADVPSGATYTIHATLATLDHTDRQEIPLPTTDGQLIVQGSPIPGAFTLAAPRMTAMAGQTTLLLLHLGSLTGIAQATFNLASATDNPDATPLVFGEAQTHSLTAGAALESVVEDGTVQVALATADNGVITGPGPFLQIPVTVPPGTAPGTVYSLVLSDLAFAGADGHSITVLEENGSLTVRGAALAGDLNGNGRIEVLDATMAMRIAVGFIAPDLHQLQVGDVMPSGAPNGKIDILDAIRILRKAVGLEQNRWP